MRRYFDDRMDGLVETPFCKHYMVVQQLDLLEPSQHLRYTRFSYGLQAAISEEIDRRYLMGVYRPRMFRNERHGPYSQSKFHFHEIYA
jgi:hypothetical protein